MRHIHHVFMGGATPVHHHAATFIVDPSDHYPPVVDSPDAKSEQYLSESDRSNSIATGHGAYDDTDRASNSSADTVLYVGSDQHTGVVQNRGTETAFDAPFGNTGFTSLLPGCPKSMEDMYPKEQSGGE